MCTGAARLPRVGLDAQARAEGRIGGVGVDTVGAAASLALGGAGSVLPEHLVGDVAAHLKGSQDSHHGQVRPSLVGGLNEGADLVHVFGRFLDLKHLHFSRAPLEHTHPPACPCRKPLPWSPNTCAKPAKHFTGTLLPSTGGAKTRL